MKPSDITCAHFSTCAPQHHQIVDGEADESAINYFKEIGSQCEPCRKHFEEVQSLKTLIVNKIPHVSAPKNLEKAIKGIID